MLSCPPTGHEKIIRARKNRLIHRRQLVRVPVNGIPAPPVGHPVRWFARRRYRPFGGGTLMPARLPASADRGHLRAHLWPAGPNPSALAGRAAARASPPPNRAPAGEPEPHLRAPGTANFIPSAKSAPGCPYAHPRNAPARPRGPAPPQHGPAHSEPDAQLFSIRSHHAIRAPALGARSPPTRHP